MFLNNGEDNFLEKLLKNVQYPDNVLIPPGDDCAVIKIGSKASVIAVDQVVEGIHYTQETSPELVAHKLLARNLSDIAAMGALPQFALISTSSDKNEEWLLRFNKGLQECAEKYNVSVIGGDMASMPIGNTASLTIIGISENDQFITRSGASENDELFATGCFGQSFLSEWHLHFTPRLKEGAWLNKNHFASAMIDVSDGLLRDVARMTKSSNLSLVLDTQKIALSKNATLDNALSDGEDYELLFAVPAKKSIELQNSWPKDFAQLAKIGTFQTQEGSLVKDLNGKILNVTGYDHLS